MSDVTDTYPDSEGFNGIGTQLLVGNGASPQTYEAVAFVRNITPGAMTTEVGDRTHLRSPGAHKEKLLGFRDSAAFTAEVIWAPRHESQSKAGGGSGSFASGGLIAMWRNRTEHDFIIRVPDVHSGSPSSLDWPFRGGVTRFQPGALGMDANAINATVEITPLRDDTADLP